MRCPQSTGSPAPRRAALLAITLATLAVPAPSLAQAPPAGAAAATAPIPPVIAPRSASPASPPGPGDRISYQVVPVVSGDASSVTTQLTTVPVLAATGEPLLGADLYVRLGRPDLAASYDARQTTRATVAGLGVAVMVGGIIYAATRPAPDIGLPPDQFRQEMDSQSQAQKTGILVSTGGLVVLAVAVFIDPNPVGAAERRQLIDEHNRRLAPSAPGGDAAEHRADGPRITFGGGLLPGGGMAQAGFVF